MQKHMNRQMEKTGFLPGMANESLSKFPRSRGAMNNLRVVTCFLIIL